MLDSATRAHIERQLKLLGKLLTEYDELLDVIPDEEPDLVRRTALSSVVQSFYQGIEGLFQTIAKRIDGNSPSSSQWHQELLRQMSKPSDVRPAVVSDDLRQRLTPTWLFDTYRGIRTRSFSIGSGCVVSSRTCAPH